MPFLFPPTVETAPSSSFRSQDLPALLADLTRRFSPSAENGFESGLEDIVGPIVQSVASSVFLSKCDIGGGGQSQDGRGWRESLQVLLSLTSVKGIAAVLPLVPSWDATSIPGRSTAPALEIFSLLGPFLRLSVFPDTFVSSLLLAAPKHGCADQCPSLPQPSIAQSYFPSPGSMTRGDIESASASIRGTLRGVQVRLASGDDPRSEVLTSRGYPFRR